MYIILTLKRAQVLDRTDSVKVIPILNLSINILIIHIRSRYDMVASRHIDIVIGCSGDISSIRPEISDLFESIN